MKLKDSLENIVEADILLHKVIVIFLNKVNPYRKICLFCSTSHNNHNNINSCIVEMKAFISVLHLFSLQERGKVGRERREQHTAHHNI